MSTKNIILFAVFVLLLLAVVGSFLYYVTMSDSSSPVESDDAIQSGADSELQRLDRLIESERYEEAREVGKEFLTTADLDESQKLEIMRLLNVAHYSDVDTPRIGQDYRELYVLLLRFANDEGNTDQFRASAYAMINQVLRNSYFNVNWFNEALKAYDDGRLYSAYASDESLNTPEAIAFSALYDLNATAENLYPDKYNKSWQAWIIALSIVEATPPDSLFDEFVVYINDKLDDIENSEGYTMGTTPMQEVWIEQALLSAKSRLLESYPDSFNFDTEQIDIQFVLLLDSIQEWQNVRSNRIGFFVRVAYADFLMTHTPDEEKVWSVLEPLFELNERTGSAYAGEWLVFENREDDYLLASLYAMSQEMENTQLRSELASLGWEY